MYVFHLSVPADFSGQVVVERNGVREVHVLKEGWHIQVRRLSWKMILLQACVINPEILIIVIKKIFDFSVPPSKNVSKTRDHSRGPSQEEVVCFFGTCFCKMYCQFYLTDGCNYFPIYLSESCQPVIFNILFRNTRYS